MHGQALHGLRWPCMAWLPASTVAHRLTGEGEDLSAHIQVKSQGPGHDVRCALAPHALMPAAVVLPT